MFFFLEKTFGTTSLFFFLENTFETPCLFIKGQAMNIIFSIIITMKWSNKFHKIITLACPPQ